MSADGPKNSQGYVPYPAHAGMTNKPLFVQLLEYTGNEFTEEVAKVWIWEAPLGAIRTVVRNLDDPCLEPALRRIILRKPHWLRQRGVI